VLPRASAGAVTPVCFWLFGPTHTGKSHHAYNVLFAGEPRFTLTLANSGTWFDGYRGEKILVIDELSDSKALTAAFLKRLTDKYLVDLPVKHNVISSQRFSAVIVTSNYALWEVYRRPEDNLPLQRRFRSVHLTKSFANVTVIPESVTDPSVLDEFADSASLDFESDLLSLVRADSPGIDSDSDY
jgi:hypothetical protein